MPQLVPFCFISLVILTVYCYNDILKTFLERIYDSLEWGLNSPPKPHSFVSLPLHSSMVDSLDNLVIAKAKQGLSRQIQTLNLFK